MKFFENKDSVFPVNHTKSNHMKARLKNISCQQKRNTEPTEPIECPINKTKDEPKPQSELAKQDMLKSLIAINQQYFQERLHKSNDGKPSELKLKIPSHTGSTIYKRDFYQSQTNLRQLKKTHLFKEKRIKCDLFAGTTYRSQYTGLQNENQSYQPKKEEIRSSIEAPTFKDSEYKHNFQNWGCNSRMISLKPQQPTAVTNMPLQKTTVYSTEFTAKVSGKNENFNPNNFMSSCSSPSSNQVMSPLFYMTTNNAYYNEKSRRKEPDLKPKTYRVALDDEAFKSKTEYQTRFMPQKKSQVELPAAKKPLEDLQNFILNL